MKFDFVIGNPPYQDTTIGENKTYAPPVYDKFMDASYDIADKVELIHPARFLFKAGSTPKAWNDKMLEDPHLKILSYEEDSRNIFPSITIPIKGGIVITYHDKSKKYGAINIFTPIAEINDILRKVMNKSDFHSLSDIMITSYAYHFTEELYETYPDLKGSLSDGHDYDLKSNVFSKMPKVFYDSKPDDGKEYIRILGRVENDRVYKYIRSSFINTVENLHKYKVFLSGATGQGTYGESLTLPILAEPGIGSTETYLSFGSFETKDEAQSLIKYICTKFARSVLGVLKKTQANTPGKWAYVPLQDFTPNSDIDWSVSVAEIDKQLYKKYGLTSEEIEFIEKNVKEMK